MGRAIIFPTLAAVTVTATILLAWFLLAIAAHAVKADPLCGRNCFDPGYGQVTLMNGGE